MTKRYALNDKTIAASKAKNAPRLTYNLTDGQNLFIEANHASAAPYVWRFQFTSPVTGKRSKLTFGAYPTIGLAAARGKAQEAREQLAQGVDPAIARATAKVVQAAVHAEHAHAELRKLTGQAPLNSFRDLAERLQRENAARWTDSYSREFELTLKKYAYPAFGDRHIASITPRDITPLNDLLADKRQMLLKLRRFVRHVFDYAIEPERSLLQMNPVVKQARLFDGMYKKPRAAATTGAGVREVMLALRGWQVSGKAANVRNAALLSAWVYQRPNEVATARKEHFDLDAGTWAIPAALMKGRKLRKNAPEAKAHVVFLATQAVALLREQFAIWPTDDYVFPNQGGSRGVRGHINRSAVGEALNRLGFKGKHCAHGFRAMARTVGEEELELSPLVLEKSLAHSRATGRDGELLNMDGGLGGAYARAQYLTKREHAAQVWADYLDTLCLPQLRLAA